MRTIARLFAAVTVFLANGSFLAADQPAIPLTRENWGTAVGFAPAAVPEGFTPGLRIDAGNVDRFATIVPEPVQTLVRHHGLILNTRAYEPIAPSDGYLAATREHRGTARPVETGDDWKTKGIEKYQGGLPFPAPQSGVEAAWNFVLAYGGDDGRSEFSVYWIDAARGVERSEEWETTYLRAMYRTDLDPRPEVPALAAEGIVVATLTRALSPLDKRGFASLYYGYREMKEPDGWIYLPQQRRTIQFSFGLKGESWNNTDLLYEDVRGYTGRPEWMRWNLIEKTTALLPLHAGAPLGKENAARVFDFKTAPHWNPALDWEPRPVYVLEATPKVPDYPYSRMRLWVDAESFHVLVKMAYDRKGNPWKVLVNALNSSPDPTAHPPVPAAGLVVDLQSRHATAFHWHKVEANVGLDPDLFRLATLRKMGR